MLDINKKIYERNIRIFREEFEIKHNSIVKKYLIREDLKKGKTFEAYTFFSILKEKHPNDLLQYWPGLNGADEKGIDFIYFNDGILYIINCKQGSLSKSFSPKDLEEIQKGLKCIFDGDETKNSTLKSFITNLEKDKIKEIKIYYACELGDKIKALNDAYIPTRIKEIEKYKKPRETSKVFTSIKVELFNYQDLYKISELITLNINYDVNYFFESGADRGFIARVKCIDIKNEITRYGIKIFQKNIRGKLGTKINNNILNTLENNGIDFFLYNNGITFIGTHITPDPKTNILTINDAQIINGQQTSFAIIKSKQIDEDSYVLCRFFEVDESKIKQITQTTNSQNSTNERDFISNDDIQIAIQEYFYEKKIFYERKKGETNVYNLIKKIINTDFAQSCLAIILKKPSYARIPSSKKFFLNEVKSNLDRIGYYDEIFNQNIEEMEKAYEIYINCYNNKKGGILAQEGWLHIASIWYRKNCKDFKSAFDIFKDFFNKEGFEKEMEEGSKPLNRNDTDLKLKIFLKD